MAGVSILTLIFGTLMMAVIQISIFKSLPNWLRGILAYYTFLSVIINFGFSSIILSFTGVGNAIGFINLAGSVVLGIYLVVYKNKRKISGIKLKTWKGWLPYPHVVEGNPEETWLF